MVVNATDAAPTLQRHLPVAPMSSSRNLLYRPDYWKSCLLIMGVKKAAKALSGESTWEGQLSGKENG